MHLLWRRLVEEALKRGIDTCSVLEMQCDMAYVMFFSGFQAAAGAKKDSGETSC